MIKFPCEETPSKFKEAKLSNIAPKWNFKDNFIEWVSEDDRILILKGSVGTGKTWACYAIKKYLQKSIEDRGAVSYLRSTKPLLDAIVEYGKSIFDQNNAALIIDDFDFYDYDLLSSVYIIHALKQLVQSKCKLVLAMSCKKYEDCFNEPMSICLNNFKTLTIENFSEDLRIKESTSV